MNAHHPLLDGHAPLPVPRPRAVALLVDGENIQADHAGRLIDRTRARLGPLAVLRVYGDAARLPDWARAPCYRFIQAQVAGKSVTDMALAVEAMELALTGRVDAIAIASNDRDFTPLIWALRQNGLPVLALSTGPAGLSRSIGAGAMIERIAAPTPSEKPKPALPDPLAAAVKAQLANGPLRLGMLGHALRSAGVAPPPGKLSAWLRARPELCLLTGEGAGLTVHPPKG